MAGSIPYPSAGRGPFCHLPGMGMPPSVELQIGKRPTKNSSKGCDDGAWLATSSGWFVFKWRMTDFTPDSSVLCPGKMSKCSC